MKPFHFYRDETHNHTHIPVAPGYPQPATHRIRDSGGKRVSDCRFERSQGSAVHATILWSSSHLLWSGTRAGVLGSRERNQVLISTVCNPSNSWISRRLHRCAKILVSQSSANFPNSALNEINSKRTRRHRIRHPKRLLGSTHWANRRLSEPGRDPGQLLAQPPEGTERVSDWPKVTQPTCGRAQCSIPGLWASWLIYQRFLAENLRKVSFFFFYY